MVPKPKWCNPHKILHSIALLSRPLVSMETRALRRGKWRKVAAEFLPIPTSALFAPSSFGYNDNNSDRYLDREREQGI